MIRRIARWILAPLYRLGLLLAPIDDPWERLDTAPRLQMYSAGARLDFQHYLAGPSSVTVKSIDDVMDWLLGCEYQEDEVLFAEADFWQHPTTFERLRAGDCEDFALWAWRKLIDLGVDADFVVGYCVRDGELEARHAWVMYRHDGVEYLFEPGSRSRERMIYVANDVRDRYIPQFGSNRAGKRFAFSGYLVSERKRLQARDS